MCSSKSKHSDCAKNWIYLNVFFFLIMRCIRIQCFTATVFLLAVYLFFFHKVWFTDKYLQTSVVLPNVIVHIDLKVPPKLKYLESLLPMFKKHGVTGLLMEYDDMFPYEGILVNISARNCYGKYEVGKFKIKKNVWWVGDRSIDN